MRRLVATDYGPSESPQMTQQRFSRAREIEIVLLFTAFIAATYGFGVYLFPAIVELIRADIPFTYGALGTISGLVQAGFMVSAIVAGLLTLRFGAVPLIRGSVFLCAVCLCGLAVAPDIYVTTVLLIVLGSCAVVVWVPMVEVSRDVIAPEHQGKALGLMSSGTSYGVFINSLLMITVLPSEGWRWLWGTTAMLVGLLAIAAVFRLRGLSARHSASPSDLTTAPVPLRARLRLLGSPLALALFAMMFLNGLSCMPFQTYLSAFIQGEALLSQSDAASAWRVIGFVGMFSGLLVGALADRITIRYAMTLTYLILAGACVTLVNVPQASSEVLLMASAVAFGTAFSAIFGLVPAYISQSFGKGNAAIVFSFANIALGLGGIVGNLLGGFLRETIGTFVAAYLVMAAAAVLSAVLSLMIPSERRNHARLQETTMVSNA